MDAGAGRAWLRGAVASLAGVMAMDAFFRVVRRAGSRQPQDDDGRRSNVDGGSLDDVSLVGRKAREGEPSTEAVGRLVYAAVTKEEPTDATRHRLGTAVHWGYGVLVGGLYGVLEEQWHGSRHRGGWPLRSASRRGGNGASVLGEGAGYGTALWLLGDELAVPLLGLAKGPTAAPVRIHAEALGAHLAYGVATATATEALRRVL